MNSKSAEISGFNGTSMGIVLVLFILLVIITQLVCSDPSSSDDPSIDINAASLFELRNASTIIPLNLDSSTSSRLPTVIRPSELIRFSLTEITTAQYSFQNRGLTAGIISFRIVPGAAEPFDRFRSSRIFYNVDLVGYPELVLFPYP
ncbi:hypothetical protein [Paenibacillus herberti]|uniref:Uncharacterized protein n=1 Tax=Paenibacillus herberti TaxID=1619309 RepID=A0A229NU97_9BACL|nr:hypothetical protein [Paenibacillus herberti]OXM13486.1 hypothetical protein CGZ75_20815 [Paenibacillus herberti]